VLCPSYISFHPGYAIGKEVKMKTFRILTAEGKPPIATKKGFCWPAFFFGVFWALYKRFWPAAGVLLVLTVVLRALPRMIDFPQLPGMRFVLLTLFVALMVVVGFYANILLTTYLVTRGYKVTSEVNANSESDAFDAVVDSLRSRPIQ
jgi:hypothetical protein